MAIQIECPSGLAGEIRGMKTKEANLFSDKQAQRKGTIVDTILERCWLSTRDSGVYGENEVDGDKVKWSRALVADRFFALVQIRIATYGPEFVFRTPCENDACAETIEWAIDLSEELEYRPIPKEAIDTLVDGGLFEAKLRDGRAVKFHLARGTDETQLTKRVRTAPDREVVLSLAQRIDEIEGVNAQDKLRALDDLDLGELPELMAKFEAVDGGYETDIEIACPHCGRAQEKRLPLDRDFFLPYRRAR